MKLTKSTYLSILGFLSCGFLPANLLGSFARDTMLILSILWSILGVILFCRNKIRIAYPTILFSVCLIFNAIYSIFVQGQPAIATIVAMRDIIGFIIFLSSLITVQPSLKNLEEAMKPLAFATIVLIPIVFICPELYATDKDMLNFAQEKAKGGNDIIPVWPGASCAVFYFYLLIGKVIKRSRKDDIILLSVFLIYIVLMQNRSTMLCALPFFAYAIFKADNKLKWLILIGIVLLGIPLSFSLFSNLAEETVIQLDNPEYNRWKALAYFFIEEQYDALNIIFGHGVPCAGSSHLAEMLYVQDADNVFIADIGLLGSFYYYGALFICIFYFFIFKAIFTKQIPISIKLYALWLLFVPTIHCLGLGNIADDFRIAVFIYFSYQYGRINYHCKL